MSILYFHDCLLRSRSSSIPQSYHMAGRRLRTHNMAHTTLSKYSKSPAVSFCIFYIHTHTHILSIENSLYTSSGKIVRPGMCDVSWLYIFINLPWSSACLQFVLQSHKPKNPIRESSCRSKEETCAGGCSCSTEPKGGSTCSRYTSFTYSLVQTHCSRMERKKKKTFTFYLQVKRNSPESQTWNVVVHYLLLSPTIQQ